VTLDLASANSHGIQRFFCLKQGDMRGFSHAKKTFFIYSFSFSNFPHLLNRVVIGHATNLIEREIIPAMNKNASTVFKFILGHRKGSNEAMTWSKVVVTRSKEINFKRIWLQEQNIANTKPTGAQ
jgi:hypothetical protein